MLIEKGGDPSNNGHWRLSPLHQAAMNGHTEAVQFLVDNGSKTIRKDKFKRSSLILAVRNGHIHIASILLKYGCPFDEPDSSKNTALHYAAAYGWPELIDLMIKTGIDINAMNSWNLTPLTVAALKNNFGCVKKFLKYPNVDVNCKDNDGRSLVSNAIINLSAESLEYLTFLIVEKNANIN